MLRKYGIILRRSSWLQALALTGLWALCARVAHVLALPVPSGILAMAVLLALLLGGGLRAPWVRRGAGGLLDHMVLFFVPAVMALLNHRELLGMVGFKLFAVIVGSTLGVMAGTALAVEASFRWRQGHVQ
jgi:holin-like protein